MGQCAYHRLDHDDRRRIRDGSITDPTTGLVLPLADESLISSGLDLDGLADRWAAQARLRPVTAEQMRGADARAQRLGVPVEWLMEQAGAAVAAAALALAASAGRVSPEASYLILCGPGNNGGDGLVAARLLSTLGVRCQVVLLSGPPEPSTPAANANWRRLDGARGVTLTHAARAHDVALFFNGIERAGLVIDAMLGTGVRGALREPISTAVDVALRARQMDVPILAVDGPTALDLSTGEPSDPVVRAHATVTFHRPKQGLATRIGRALAGRVLVAPIGIPLEADRG